MRRLTLSLLLLVALATPAFAQSDLATFPSENVAFIIGPQLKSGSALNPRPAFDRIARDRGIYWGAQFPATVPTDAAGLDWFILQQYYDQGLVQYTNYYRTGDPQFLAYARKITDAWWQGPAFKSGTITVDEGMSPRNASAAGEMLRAMDGHPEYWDAINRWTRAMFDMWLTRNRNAGGLVYGVRDGGYMLLYATQLAKVLPDTFPLTNGGVETHGAEIRAQYLADAEDLAVYYYGRLQYADGSWRWNNVEYDGTIGIMQPFQIGLLDQALGDLYFLTTDADVKEKLRYMITKSVVNLHTGGAFIAGPSVDGFDVLGYEYFIYGGTEQDPTLFAFGNVSKPVATTAAIQEARALGQTLQFVYGLALVITHDPKFREWGDAVFRGGYGEPADGGDGLHNFAAGDVKSYNESFRTSGRWLGYRAMASTSIQQLLLGIRTAFERLAEMVK